ncbi:MAG: hypothetical protein ACTSO9_14055 [Candidatus Helarchaeota archaeon]
MKITKKLIIILLILEISLLSSINIQLCHNQTKTNLRNLLKISLIDDIKTENDMKIPMKSMEEGSSSSSSSSGSDTGIDPSTMTWIILGILIVISIIVCIASGGKKVIIPV